jgi:hypothetical protein
MRKFAIGLLVFIGIIIAIIWLFFRRPSPDPELVASPTPTPVTQLQDERIPPDTSDDLGEAGAVFTTELRGQNQVRNGQVRLLSVPPNQILVTVVLAQPISVSAPATVRLHEGSCEAVGERVADLAVISEYAVEGVVRRSLPTLLPEGERRVVVVAAEPATTTDYLLCGTVARAATLSTMNFPSLRRIAPVQTHQPANTGWSW